MKCGEPAELQQDMTLVDPRYGLGYCEGKCRGLQNLVLATRDEVTTLIAGRGDKVLRQKQMNELRVGLIPAHPWRLGCCEVKPATHLEPDRLAMLLGLMGIRVDTGA